MNNLNDFANLRYPLQSMRNIRTYYILHFFRNDNINVGNM